MITLIYNNKSKDSASISLKNTQESIAKALEFIDSFLEKYECSMKANAQIDIALDEIFSNIVKFAYGDKDGHIGISLEYVPDIESVKIQFVDSGFPFNPLDKEEPDISLGIDERQIGGLGIHIVKKTMDSVSYENVEGNNVLELVKKIH